MSAVRPISHHTYFIELTNHCNMHCTFCPSDELVKSRTLATEDIVEKCIRQIAETGAVSSVINFNVLGEPLLNKKIFQYIELCRALGVRCAVVTNLTLLTETNIERLLAFDNLVLVLSVQTPTAKSYEIRGYKHMSFDDYMEVIDKVVLAKFRTGSQTWIEIHVADNNRMDNLYRENGQALWSIYEDSAEQQAVVDGLIARCQRLAVEAQAQFGEAYAAAIRPAGAAEDFAPIRDNPNIREDEFWGWMFAPNVFFRIKSFGLWALQSNFLAKFLEPGEKAFVEEYEGSFICPMGQKTFAMLADGQFTPCCLDYDGEVDFGNIKDRTVAQAFWSIERSRLVEDASAYKTCRRCKGRAFVFETTAPSVGRNYPVEMFGRGWHGFEETLVGRGGRWSDGRGVFYVYGRAGIEAIRLGLLSVFPSDTDLKLVVSQADDALETFTPVREVAFRVERNDMASVDVEVALPPGALYRCELRSPSFRPCDVQDSNDHRQLGLVVFAAEARFDPAAANASPLGGVQFDVRELTAESVQTSPTHVGEVA